MFWMFDSKILLQAICGSILDYPRQPEPANHTWDVAPLTKTWLLWEVSSTLSSPQITQDGESCLLSLLRACFSCVLEHTLLHRKCGMGMPSELGKSFSSNRRCPARISCRTSSWGLGQCPPLVHQGPDSIHQSKHSPFLNKKQEQDTALGILCHRNGSAPASLKMRAGKWRKPCLDHENSCSGKSLRNVAVLEQKKASFAGIISWKVGAGKRLELGWQHSRQPVFNPWDCVSPGSCLCSLTSLLSSACHCCPNNPPVSMDMSSQSLRKASLRTWTSPQPVLVLSLTPKMSPKNDAWGVQTPQISHCKQHSQASFIFQNKSWDWALFCCNI